MRFQFGLEKMPRSGVRLTWRLAWLPGHHLPGATSANLRTGSADADPYPNEWQLAGCNSQRSNDQDWRAKRSTWIFQIYNEHSERSEFL